MSDFDAERRARVARLIGEVVAVDDDHLTDTITLTYRDGHQVSLTGLGYDGLWQHVIVMADVPTP